jgi:hypothetical protein
VATIPQYISAMRQRQDVIARKFGCDISQADKQTRVLNLSMLALLAVVVKTLVDNGVITDAQLNAVMDAARDGSYPDEPNHPPE